MNIFFNFYKLDLELLRLVFMRDSKHIKKRSIIFLIFLGTLLSKYLSSNNLNDEYFEFKQGRAKNFIP